MARRKTDSENEERQAVEALAKCWDSLCQHVIPLVDQEYQDLIDRWQPLLAVDPLTSPMDLLSPLGQEDKETTHTRVLAYLLNPAANHELGAAPLRAFVDLIHRLHKERNKAQAAAFLDATKGCTTAVVHCERAVALLGSELDSEEGNIRLRTDLWLELPNSVPSAIIVIENKIGDVARRGQLAAYDKAIERRVGDRNPHVTRIYLSRRGEDPPSDAGGKDWIPCSYAELGYSFAPLVTRTELAGHQFLRLYLATIFQKVLDLKRGHELPRIARYMLAEYIRSRLARLP